MSNAFGALKPLPGAPKSVVIQLNCGQTGFVVYDDSTARPVTASGSNLPGFDGTGVNFVAGYWKFHVSPLGVSLLATSSQFLGDAVYDEGFIYVSNGEKIDPASFTILGLFLPAGQSYPTPGTTLTPDATLGKGFGFGFGISGIGIFDLNTFTQLDTIPVGSSYIGTPLVRWGDDGLAGNGTIIRSSQVQSGTPVNRQPWLKSISPTTAPSTSGDATLTVSGVQFVSGAVVQWNGAGLTTTFVSSTQLTATIPAASFATLGKAAITIFNPAPGGGTSNLAWFEVTGPVPTIQSLSPSSAPNGGAPFTLSITATNVTPDSVVYWNGQPRLTTFTNDGKLQISVATSDLDVPKSVDITVEEAASSNTPSTAAAFQVTAAPLIKIQQTNLWFGTVPIGTLSTPQSVTVQNIGTAPMHISQVSTTGEYTVTNNCPNAIPVSSSCTISVVYAPVTRAYSSGTLTVVSDAPNTASAVTYSGLSGYAKLWVSQSSMAFSAAANGVASAKQYIYLSSSGTLPVTVSGITLSPGFELVSNVCPSQLLYNYACGLLLDARPTNGGIFTGNLTITSNDIDNPVLNIPLLGAGTDFSASLGRPSRGGRSSDSPTVGLSPGPPATMQIMVSGTDLLSGRGADFSASFGTPSLRSRTSQSPSLQLASGHPATMQIVVSGTELFDDDVTVSCSGLPAQVSCTPSPATFHMKGAATRTIDVVLLAKADSRSPSHAARPWAGLFFLLPLGIVFTLQERRRRGVFALLLCLALLACLSCSPMARVAQPGVGNSGKGTSRLFQLTLSIKASAVQHELQTTVELLD